MQDSSRRLASKGWRLYITLAAVLLQLSGSVLANGQQALSAAPRKPSLLLGAAWYPEQWPESRWDADLQLMEDAHIHFVRVAEFAWSTMEPHEGEYRFDWLKDAVRAAERHHIAVVLGTPTAAPPSWLTQKYPSTLRITETGVPDVHGNRRQFNLTDAKYLELARDIAERLAEQFGHDANVIGWQIDNEIGNESYGKDTRLEFQQWLQHRYGTLEELNRRWTTAYWSETYQDWSQIQIPATGANPGLFLNWKQFLSDKWREYDKNQIVVIRKNADARQFITTNLMGWYDGFDHYVVTQDLDMASWDDYVGSGQLDPVANGAKHDLTRGFLHRNFWVMETQPGSVNWSPTNNTLDRGGVYAMAWNAIGHGAEAVEYWQWRSALNGQEQYHGVLVGSDGTPVPLYDEVARVGKDFEKAASALTGTTVCSQVALLYDYDSRWALEWQPHNKNFSYLDEFLRYYQGLRHVAGSVDVVSDLSSLKQYKLVVAPALNVLSKRASQNLSEYVRGGGHLVLGQRSAMKDDDNSLWPQRQPGPLADLLGASVEQFYALATPVLASGSWGTGTDYQWADQIHVTSPDTHVLMRYGVGGGWLDDQPAVVSRQIDAGSITYVGMELRGNVLAQASTWMAKEAGVETALPPMPDEIDVAIRTSDHKQILILTNYGPRSQTIHLLGSYTDVLNGGTVQSVTLNHYGVAVLEQRREDIHEHR